MLALITGQPCSHVIPGGCPLAPQQVGAGIVTCTLRRKMLPSVFHNALGTLVRGALGVLCHALKLAGIAAHLFQGVGRGVDPIQLQTRKSAKTVEDPPSCLSTGFYCLYVPLAGLSCPDGGAVHRVPEDHPGGAPGDG
jgi:hypothetical protein